MATPKKVVTNFGKCCRLCLKDLEISQKGKMCLSKRRDLTTAASFNLLKNVQEFLPEFQPEVGKSYLCLECVNKLNKYERIKSKYQSVKSEFEFEKEGISNMCLKTAGKRVKRVLLTPQRPRSIAKVYKSSLNANVDAIKSPSKIPVFTGVNKENICHGSRDLIQKTYDSPTKIPVPHVATHRAEKPGAKKKLSLTPETPPNLCQVIYNFPSQTKRKVLDNNQTYLKIARSMIEDRPKQLASAVWNDDVLREDISDLISSSVYKECTKLCEVKGNSILQNVEATQLLSFEFSKVLEEWKNKAPVFLKVLTSAVTIKDILETKHIVNIAFAGSVLLRCRNPKMSAISHIVGLLLDYGGTNDETIERLCRLGASVSTDSVYLKKHEISKLHDKQVSEKLTEYKNCVTDKATSMKTIQSINNLTDNVPSASTALSTDVGQLPGSMDGVQVSFSPRIQVVNSSSTIFTNSFMPFTDPKAALTSSVSDIMMICKNTEEIKVNKTEKSDIQLDFHTRTTTLPSINTESMFVQTADVKETKLRTEKVLERCNSKLESRVNIELYGDNCDLRVNRSHQSKERKVKDFHWFLTLGAELRVKAINLSDKNPQKPINTVKNEEFLPSAEDNNGLQECFAHHLQKVLVKNIKCLEKFSDVVPEMIDHPNIDNYKQKSEYFLIDLYDKNESKNEDMIDILSDLHQKCIPFIESAGENDIIERKVFGGDVLTNERAYQAQLDMTNGETDSDKLLGFIHRPEGLHRLMNLLKYIFDVFYLTSSVNEQGTLYQLKCLLDRRDVKLDMTTSYRQCKNFIDDILDGHIIAAACHYFGMKDQNSTPTQNKIPGYIELTSVENQLEWINGVAKNIIEIYVMEGSGTIPDIFEDIQYMQTQMDSLTNLDITGKYKCPHENCQKKYKQFHWLKRHLKEKHNTTVNINPPQHSSSSSSVYDGKFNVASAFMKVSLLFRDTEDAYKMGDGNRLIRNAKYEMLHFHQGHHIKYRLWMWRVLAYYISILSEKEAYEYKWNMSFNMGRGVGHLIPNDNLVEINVHLLKDQCRKMGANITFEGCRRWVKCIKFLSDLCGAYDKAVSKPEKSGKHAKAKRESDISLVVAELNEADVFNFTNGREHASYVNFSSDLLASLDTVELNDWINKNKKRAQKEM